MGLRALIARRALAIAIASAAAAAAACATDPAPAPGRQRPAITAVASAEIVVEGSLVRVTGLRLDDLGTSPLLRVEPVAGGPRVDLPSEPSDDPAERLFVVTGELVAVIGEGTHDVTLTLLGASQPSEPYPYTLGVAGALPLAIDVLPSGDVHRNELGIVRGDGLLAPGEGSVTAWFHGTFTPASGGAARDVDASLPILPTEPFGRTRGIVRLTTALGGAEPGAFEGTIEVTSAQRSGDSSTVPAQRTTLRFLPPELFAIEPSTASLEQIVTIRGAGFLGGDDEPDEATIIQVEGVVTPEGQPSMSFGPAALVLSWISGTELRGRLEATPVDGRLVSSLFGFREGTFTGYASAVVIKGTQELSGATVPFSLTLAPVKQVVWLRFLPGFYESLTRFGIAASSGVIEGLVRDRIHGIYDDYNVEVRLERPTDFSESGYAKLEIGGPDPNGIGLFGYDNTPGKDVGNLRLHDLIGGTNAQTQADGTLGYGGVFVDSFLYWSSHPGLPGDRPTGAPDPEPEFDEVFDAVRARPATLSEVNGDGDPDRVRVVAQAIRALANVVGETAAHELGHSFGLADPYGPATTYHDPYDEPGCLMDSGNDRPFGERAGLDGYTPTHLCHDAPAYLSDVLGR